MKQLFLLFQNCFCLEELYLSHNGISKMEGLADVSNLRILDISSNKISAIEDISGLAK
jgi:protein phosphatase 1 regulatory subunit 7